jgi:hypothetical protein
MRNPLQGGEDRLVPRVATGACRRKRARDGTRASGLAMGRDVSCRLGMFSLRVIAGHREPLRAPRPMSAAGGSSQRERSYRRSDQQWRSRSRFEGASPINSDLALRTPGGSCRKSSRLRSCCGRPCNSGKMIWNCQQEDQCSRDHASQSGDTLPGNFKFSQFDFYSVHLLS